MEPTLLLAERTWEVPRRGRVAGSKSKLKYSTNHKARKPANKPVALGGTGPGKPVANWGKQ